MKILTDITTNYKVDTMDVSSLSKRWHNFDTAGATTSIDAIETSDGEVYIVVPGVTITLIEAGIPVGGVVRFVRDNESGEATITTTDSWVNSTYCGLSVGQYVDFIWTLAGWISVGNFTQ